LSVNFFNFNYFGFQIQETQSNGASLSGLCMKNQMKTLVKTVIISYAKYNPNIPWISYADPS
jgi:hypothetical protein